MVSYVTPQKPHRCQEAKLEARLMYVRQKTFLILSQVKELGVVHTQLNLVSSRRVGSVREMFEGWFQLKAILWKNWLQKKAHFISKFL
jgi:hypothetical protein